MVVTVVIPVVASFVVEVVVVFTSLSVVTVVTGEDPSPFSVVVTVVVDTLSVFPSVATLLELVTPLEVAVFDAVLLVLALDVLVLTVVVVVVTVVTTSPEDLVSFLVVTDVDFDDGAAVATELVEADADVDVGVPSVADVSEDAAAVDEFKLAELPLTVEVSCCKPRSDTIAMACGARRTRAGDYAVRREMQL